MGQSGPTSAGLQGSLSSPPRSDRGLVPNWSVPKVLVSSGTCYRVQGEAWGDSGPSPLPHQPAHLMMGLKRMSKVFMNVVGCTMYRALMFFLYLQRQNKWVGMAAEAEQTGGHGSRGTELGS